MTRLEIEQQIAIKIVGCNASILKTDNETCLVCDCPDGIHGDPLPSYLTDIVAAMTILCKTRQIINETYFQIDYWGNKYRCQIGLKAGTVAEADSISEAICLSALKAVARE